MYKNNHTMTSTTSISSCVTSVPPRGTKLFHEIKSRIAKANCAGISSIAVNSYYHEAHVARTTLNVARRKKTLAEGCSRSLSSLESCWLETRRDSEREGARGCWGDLTASATSFCAQHRTVGELSRKSATERLFWRYVAPLRPHRTLKPALMLSRETRKRAWQSNGIVKSGWQCKLYRSCSTLKS